MPSVTDAVFCSPRANDCRRAWSSTRKRNPRRRAAEPKDENP
jgi:hypothetical protein